MISEIRDEFILMWRHTLLLVHMHTNTANNSNIRSAFCQKQEDWTNDHTCVCV